MDDPFEVALREVGRIDSDEVQSFGSDAADAKTDPGTQGQASSPPTDPGDAADDLPGAGPPDDLHVRLYVMEGPGKGGTIELPHTRRVVLGRSSRCEVPLRDLSVSRRHAELRWEDAEGFFLRDLGSRNGCAVDNARVEGWVRVSSGQVIAIGDLRLRLEYGGVKEHTFIREDPSLTPAAPLHRPQDQRPPTHDLPPPPLASSRPSGAGRPLPPPTREPRAAPAATEEPPGHDSNTYRGSFPPRPTPRLDPTVKRILAISAGLLIAGGLWLALALVSSGEESPPPRAQPTTMSLATRLDAARARIEAKAWEDAIDRLERLRKETPSDATVRDLLGLARREAAARNALEEGRAAIDRHRYPAGIRRLMAVPDDSGYAPSAGAELKRAERLYLAPRLEIARTHLARGNARKALDKVLGPLLTVWPGHPEATRLRDEAAALLAAERAAEPEPTPVPDADVATKPAPRAATRKPPRRRPRSTPRRAPRHPPPARSSAKDRALVTQSRDAFERGKVDGALTAAETASDLGVAGASRVADRIRRFQNAMREANRSKQVARALGSYTDALFLAEEITPGGGVPARKLRKNLAQLHYMAAMKEQKAGKTSNARRHLNKALGYDPTHARARALRDRL